MSTSFDAIIVGAGILGCACARELAEAGIHVAVLEQNAPGGGITAAGMGHIVALDDSPALLALTTYGQSLWAQLAPTLPPRIEYEQRGTLWIADDEEEMAYVHAQYASGGIAGELLDAAALAEAEPALRPGLRGALLVPADTVLYPPAAAQALLAAAEQHRVHRIHGTVIQAGDGSVTLAGGATLFSEHIVLAAGTNTSLTPWLNLRRRKGHLVITDRYPGLVHHQLVELGYLKSAHGSDADSVAFNVQPRSSGQLLIGSSRQYGSTGHATEAAMIGTMLRRALTYLPALESLSAIRAWTGFRSVTPDKLPLIGPTADPTLYLLAGFEGYGITAAPAAARLLADHLLNRHSRIDPAPYLPERLERNQDNLG